MKGIDVNVRQTSVAACVSHDLCLALFLHRLPTNNSAKQSNGNDG
jgi:hypothetical protein